MKAQLFVFAVLLVATLAEDVEREDLAVAESGYHYDYYPAPLPESHSSGSSSHGHLSKGYDSHGHGQYSDHGLDEKTGYDKHGSHLISSYGDHGKQGAHGGHEDHYGKHTAFVKNSGHGYEKSYSFDKQVHLHDVDAHKAAHHDSHSDHGKHGYKDAGHYDQHGHKLYGAHDKHGSYGYGSSGHHKSDYGHEGYDKHISGKPSYAITYGSGSSHYGPAAPVYVQKAVVESPVYLPKPVVAEAPVYAHKRIVPVYHPKVAIPIHSKPAVPGYYSYHH